MNSARLGLAVVWLAAVGCGAREPHPAPARASGPPTTSGGIALGNLDSQIRGSEAFPEDVAVAEDLGALLSVRAEVVGRVNDLERLLALAEHVVARHPEQARAHLLAARAHARLHQFSRASSDLDEAGRRGADPLSVDLVRAGILRATGRVDEALPILRRAAAIAPDVRTLNGLAQAEGERGRRREAERLFARALGLVRDVSPFPVAAVELGEALLCEKNHDLSCAEQSYERVLARLPHHAVAASHLAGLEERRGERAAAIRRLEALVARSNDPEHVGHLARLYREVGRAGEAARLREKARARFEELVRRHPAAFASHAARFWLEVMGDPARAAELAATAIVEVRSVEGVELAATAFAAAGDGARACALVEGVATGPGAPDDLRELERALCRDGADRPDQSAQ